MADNYTGYSTDNTYWTLRKRGSWFLVARRKAGTYEEVERYGWYQRAGAAATAVGLLSYMKGLSDGQELISTAVKAKLDELARSLPIPERSVDVDSDGDEFDDEG